MGLTSRGVDFHWKGGYIRAANMGMVFADFGIAMGVFFANFGIAMGVFFANFGMAMG